MTEVKVYLDEARSGFVVCQECGRSKRIEFANDDNPLSGTVKRACGNSFSVTFEKRRHYRRKVKTFGKCFAPKDTFDGALVQVTDISMTGIGFIKLDGRPLKLDETIRVSIPLGEGTIDCAACVHNIGKEGNIGARFMNLNEHNKKVLGFFLLP
jgi:hypothetical protein